MMTAPLKAPFPWFGGKSAVAPLVWERFGDVRNYVEPFMGSLAMLLGRPEPWKGTETVNDADGMVSNFWRAVRADPEATAYHADWPVNENDLHARHAWLVGRKDDITRRLEGDPEWCDVKAAGWWCWGACCWIGSGWCAGDGPWTVVDGELIRTGESGGQRRKLVHLGNAKQGVNRQLVHLGSAGQGVNRKLVHLGDAGQGVNRNLVHLGNAGRGVNRKREDIDAYFNHLADRLRDVRVCCGDWSRVCGPTPTVKRGLTAVFLDPPYADSAERDPRLYATDSLDVAHAVRTWAVERGSDPMMRIALCGYEGEHDMPADWDCVAWKARGGYGSQGKGGNANATRERIWFSPHCPRPDEALPLFGGAR